MSANFGVSAYRGAQFTTTLSGVWPDQSSRHGAMSAATCRARRPHLDLRRLDACHQQAVWCHLQSLPSDDRAARFGFALKAEAIDQWLARVDWSGQRWWGAWLADGGGLIGVLQLAPCNAPGVWELGLSVHPQLRGKGVATLLLATAQQQQPELCALACHHGHGALRVIARRLGYRVRAQRESPRMMLFVNGA